MNTENTIPIDEQIEKLSALIATLGHKTSFKLKLKYKKYRKKLKKLITPQSAPNFSPPSSDKDYTT